MQNSELLLLSASLSLRGNITDLSYVYGYVSPSCDSCDGTQSRYQAVQCIAVMVMRPGWCEPAVRTVGVGGDEGDI